MKNCPYCYCENDDNVNICKECGATIDSLASFDEKETFVIICPVCGHAYTVQNSDTKITLCDDCGYDLSSEIPIKNVSRELCITLQRLSTKQKYTISSKNNTILGRDAPGEINEASFSKDCFSRNECIIEYNNGLWLIHTENNHGHLSINGEPIPTNSRRTLTNGDIITIYTCRFRVIM